MAAAEVLLAHDIPVAFAVHAVPTQMSSYEVVERGAAAGIVITASHNPWIDNGFKVKAPTGAAAGPDILGVIERRLAANGGIGHRPPAVRRRRGGRPRRALRPVRGLRAVRPADGRPRRAARRPTSSILVDPMWGAGSGWLSRLLGGGRIRVDEIHQERNPYFGGVNPEPIRPNIDEALGIARRAAATTSACCSTATRTAPARRTSSGTFIHQLQVTGLLMYYLAEHRGLRDPVVVSVNNTSMAARLGEHYGITTHETPVGFKFIGPKMIETGAMMGAEESGGFGFGMHLPERDGVYADLLLLDLFLRERAAGRWPVSSAVEHFHELAGPSFYRRIDVHVDRAVYPETKRRLLVDLRGRAADGARRAAGRPDAAARHERRLQVLRRRRVVAARPDVRHGAAGPGLHGGDVRPSRDALLDAGERLVRGS